MLLSRAPGPLSVLPGLVIFTHLPPASSALGQGNFTSSLSLYFPFLFYFLFIFLTGLWYLCLLAITLHNTYRLKNFFFIFSSSSSSSFVVGKKKSCFPKLYVADICNEDVACFLGTKSTVSNIVYAASLCKGLLIRHDVL